MLADHPAIQTALASIATGTASGIAYVAGTAVDNINCSPGTLITFVGVVASATWAICWQFGNLRKEIERVRGDYNTGHATLTQRLTDLPCTSCQQKQPEHTRQHETDHYIY